MARVGGKVFWRLWSVAERAMRSDGVAVVTPSLDQHLRLRSILGDSLIQQSVPDFAVEALVKAVIPKLARLDLERRQPVPHRLCGELATNI